MNTVFNIFLCFFTYFISLIQSDSVTTCITCVILITLRLIRVSFRSIYPHVTNSNLFFYFNSFSSNTSDTSRPNFNCITIDYNIFCSSFYDNQVIRITDSAIHRSITTATCIAAIMLCYHLCRERYFTSVLVVRHTLCYCTRKGNSSIP